MTSPFFPKRLMLVAAAVLFLACPAVQAQQAPTQAEAPPVAAAPAASATPQAPVSLADGYVLGTGDVVEVAVLGRSEFQARVQVQTDGTIQLPYLHSVPATNLTVLQLRERVRKLLKDGGYYNDPVVAVAVATFASRYVTVLGEVGSPGLLPVDRAYRVSEVLARVGGVRATGDDMLIVRRATGEELKLAINAISSGGPQDDPYVSPGDKIFVAAAPSFYIYGQVAQPGSYRVEHDMTIRKALARGGGLTQRGSDRKVHVFRDGKDIGKVDLSAAVKGGDTIVIGERFF
ncbi:MAG: SLBB domain-containing protein [Sphingomonas sp.]|jgi:polysaccharide export outer membrane protein